jgi:hypothetical protein
VEEAKTRAPRLLFDVAGTQSDGFEFAWEAKFRGGIPHEFGIRLRFGAAESMIQVENAELQIPSGRKFDQRMQQAH